MIFFSKKTQEPRFKEIYTFNTGMEVISKRFFRTKLKKWLKISLQGKIIREVQNDFSS